MTEKTTGLPHKYLRHEKIFPHIWCPGCGNGIVLGSLVRAIDRSGLKQDDIVLVSGIGCSGRMTVYADFNTLHTTHGRALTFATGIISISELAMVTGASFVGRGTVFHVQLLDTLIEKALLKKGFSVVEVLSNCHVYFGRKNNMGSPVKMMKWFQERAVTIEKAQQMKDGELEGKVRIGILTDSDKPSFLEKYQPVRERAKASLKK